MNRFAPPLRVARRETAFSLVELVIALAVAAFSITTIVSLFPVGLNAALESRRQTRAAYLAEQVIGDLRSSSFTNATIVYRENDGTLASLASFNLAVATTNFLTCDGENNVLSAATSDEYASGVKNTSASYLVQVTAEPMAINGLSKVSVEISVPAQAPLVSRSRYGFQTMIGNRR